MYAFVVVHHLFNVGLRRPVQSAVRVTTEVSTEVVLRVTNTFQNVLVLVDEEIEKLLGVFHYCHQVIYVDANVLVAISGVT